MYVASRQMTATARAEAIQGALYSTCCWPWYYPAQPSMNSIYTSVSTNLLAFSIFISFFRLDLDSASRIFPVSSNNYVGNSANSKHITWYVSKGLVLDCRLPFHSHDLRIKHLRVSHFYVFFFVTDMAVTNLEIFV